MEICSNGFHVGTLIDFMVIPEISAGFQQPFIDVVSSALDFWQ